jgi:hypothetical protein
MEMNRVVLQVMHQDVKLSQQEMPVQFTNFMTRTVRQKHHNKTTPTFGFNIGEMLHHT